MKITKANFTYRINDKVILINDLDMGNISVTNDIENVIEYICNTERIQKENFVWIYNDSDGCWCGFDIINNSFFFLEAESIEAILNLPEIIKRIDKLK